MTRTLPLLGLLLLLPLVACGSIDPAPPVDEEGVPIPQPAPFDDWLRIVAVSPDGGEVGVRPTVRVTFSDYLDDDALLDFSALLIQSGGLRVQGRVTYQMTSRSLIFTPLRDLETGLAYRIVPNAAYLVSVTGSPFEAAELPEFEVSEGASDGVDELAIDATWPQVEAILEAKCRSCHADPKWQLNPLTRESMIGVRSEQIDQFVVVPFDPAASYLMHKVLPGFPLRRFTVQPPPWSDAAPLSTGELLLLETWIKNGAR